MTLLHVRLFGDKTVINLPSAFRKGRISLRGYRVLFNRDNHGYHHMSVRSTILGRANVAAFTAEGNPDGYTAELPIWLNPENKLSEDKSMAWDLGRVENPGSAIQFDMRLYNCIERKRYDQAFFPESTLDVNIRTLKGLSAHQLYFGQYGTAVPLYLFPKSYLPSQALTTEPTASPITLKTEPCSTARAPLSPPPSPRPLPTPRGSMCTRACKSVTWTPQRAEKIIPITDEH
jgi:hypothetical protein